MIDQATETALGAAPDLRRMLVPVGPVAIFGSSNFPFAFSVAGGDTASALAAGCPVVLKAHSSHPLTSLRSFEALSSGLARAEAPGRHDQSRFWASGGKSSCCSSGDQGGWLYRLAGRGQSSATRNKRS